MADQSADDLDYMLPANCPSPYFDTWDRHNSIAFSATKGLRNAPGENNCFVNCAVQVFWHLDVFRRSYRRLLGHTCMGNSCIFCALKVIFTQFQYSDKTSLHPDALRKALAETFANQQRFQLGHMDDAAECFENILRRIHFHIACSHNEDACTAPHCLPHQKFSMAVYEKVVCPCGASSSPLKFSEMVHYVSASALVAQSRMMQENGDALHSDRFGLLLRKASAMGDVRNCPANCGKQVQKQRTLLNIPDVVSVGLVWDSDHPSVETTTEVASALGTAILLQDMYHRVMPDVRKLPRLQLVAIVCYYGKHYSTFVFHSKLKTWIYFDDATVREIGPQWENVVEKCSRGRFQPLLLLYANPSAAPVSVETAPRKRVMAPGYAPVGAPEDSDSGLDRTHESIKSMASKRSSNPNSKKPDHQGHQTSSQPQRSAEQDNGRDSPGRLTREHSRQPSFLYAMSGKVDKNKMGEGGEGGNLAGGAPSHPLRRQLFDGGASSGHLETMVEDGDEYADYTLSSGDQYRRPSLNAVESGNQLPMPPNMARYPDAQRKDSFTKRTPSKEKGVDVVRYQMDPNRAGSRTPDFTHGEGYSPQKGDHQKPSAAHHGRQRSLSSGRDDDGGDVSSGSQHVVVKPKPTGHGNYDSVDGRSHTPVQSGLATLPRNKSQNHESASSHHRSTHQEVAQIIRKTNAQCRPVAPPLPPGTPPPEYDAVKDPSQPHSRQTSTSSQASTLKGSVSMGCIDQVSKKSDSEKAKKKVKKEKKSEKDPSAKKSDKKKAKSDSALKKSESESDLLADKSNKYIDRRMVENILKHQGVHRQNSSCSNNSVSSVDSDSLMGKLLASKAAHGNLTVDIPYDNMSIGSQKDSGYGSSDRNSSSSTGSGTINPFEQYFVSKSMVIPRSVNTQHLVDQQFPQYNKGPAEPYGGQQMTSHPNGHREDGRKIMHPIKESSQEDMLKLSPNEPIGTQKFIVASVPAPAMDSRPPPVPPKNFAQFQIIKSSQSAHERESSLDSLDKDEAINNHFVSLCKKADALMDNCMLAETQDDIPSALHYCRDALSCLKEAMAQKDLTSKALTYVQKKHNSCLLKSRTLQKKAPASRQESHSSGIGSDITSVGNRSSITSSDSDMSDQVNRQLRLDIKPAAPQHRSHPSQDSTSGRVMHERQNRQSVDSSRQMDGRMSAYPGAHQRMMNPMQQDSGVHHHRTDNNGPTHMSHSHSATLAQGSGGSSGADSGGSNADLYGTLPRDKSRKPKSEAPTNPEVYQSFLNKQKCLQAGVTSSQQSLDSVKSDSGSDHSSSGQKMSKSEIRQLLQDKFLRQQSSSATQQQSGAAQQYPHQQFGAAQQYPQQHQEQQRQDVRPQVMPQRPGQNYGQNVPPSQAGHFPRPQQQYPQYPQHPHQQHPAAQQQYHHLQQQQQQQQQSYHHQQYPQHQQQQQSRQPTPGYPTHNPTHTTQRTPSQNAPPVSNQKPSLPYPSAAAAKASRPPANQGPAFHPQPNASESTNERVHTPEGSIDSQRSVPVSDGASSDTDGVAVSVRALASRFESSDAVVGHAGSSGSRPCSRNGSVKSEGKDRAQGAPTVQRTRSKSESSSRKPKSVLKNKKNKSRARKSVTFADSIANFANCDDTNSGYESAKEMSTPRVTMDNRAYYSDDEERLGSHVSYSDNDLDDTEDTGSSNSDDSPVAEEDACQLCNKRRKERGKLFCDKCSFYMGRLKSS